MNNKGRNWKPGEILGILAIVGLVFVVYSGALAGDDVVRTSTTYDYTGQNVKVNLESDDQYTGSSVDPTFYVYDSKPDNMGNCRVSVEEGYIDTGTSSSGTYTVQEMPGTYYVRGDLSSYYCQYFTVDVPAEGDATLSDYNSEPETEKLHYVQADTMSIGDFDMGTLSNSSSEQDFTIVDTYTTTDNYGLEIDEIKFQEDATNAFATDTDGDGTYDEGIVSIDVQVSDGGKTETKTLFDSTASIDEFGGDDVALLDEDFSLGEKETLTMQFDVTCAGTFDTAGTAGNERCVDGEDILDNIVIVDKEGTTATAKLTG